MMQGCTLKPIPFACALLLASTTVQAQTPPDAGQVLQDTQLKAIQPQAPSADIELPEQPLLETQPGGQAIELEAIEFQGNSVFDDAHLLSQLTAPFEQAQDLAGLRSLTNQISQYYRNHGYPFARAYLPQQKLSEGKLLIGVLEGRYGKVQAQGELKDAIQPFLNAGLSEGDLIASDQLERTTLIIGDLPGIQVSPVMRPGDNTGEGNLDMQSEPGKRYQANLSLDNHGNRSTGAYRAMANLSGNRLLTIGDQASLTAMRTNEGMWFGSARYDLPLGYSGLRGFASYVRTDYELGTSEFEDADISGVVDIVSAGINYPIVRSQTSNLKLGAQFDHKNITDENGQADTKTTKNIKALPVSLQFDHRDSLGGGGVTYGALTATVGDLTLEDKDQKTLDAATADTQGRYGKLHLDLARIQNIGQGFTAYLRGVGQWANTNLDSSEGLSLGGPRGVRAYPQGEASGDMGWLTQLEIRYRWQKLTPYVFVDKGRVITNVERWDDSNNTRDLAGAGLGVKVNYQAWSADLSAAWRGQGGEPQSDTEDRTPRIWGRVSYQF